MCHDSETYLPPTSAGARDVEALWTLVRSAEEVVLHAADQRRDAGAVLRGDVALQAAQSAYDVTALRVQNQKGLLVEELDALAALTQARTFRDLQVSLGK